jgi:uncharacterized protein (TIGR03435 family)
MMPASLFIPAMLALAGMGYAQTPPRPEFEVASVKPNTSGTPSVRINGGLASPRFAATNISLRMLITIAYNVKNFEISGGNGVIDAGRYDIEARAAEAKPGEEQSRLMLQALLADRFQLMVHRETKEVPIYALVPAKGGAKLAEPKEGSCVKFDPAAPPPPPTPGQPPPKLCGGFIMGLNTLRGGKISMTQFVDGLSNILGRPVIDKTGYTGTFDAALEFSREGVDMVGMFGGLPAMVLPPDDDSKPSIFTALQDQLGLKLESQKGPAQILVIDHAEKASEN